VTPAVYDEPRLLAIRNVLHSGAFCTSRRLSFCALVRLRPERKSLAQRVTLYSRLKSTIV
jgi:hypothetical protein